jgi:outer membrane protein insertion porin family
MFVSPAKTFRHFYPLIVFAIFIISIVSCTTIKNYPTNKPFVYETNINIEGKFSTEEKKQLKGQLYQQLHDSIGVSKQQKWIFWYTLKKPPIYDSLNADKSVIYMQALLNSLGYYRDSITYDTTLAIDEDKYMTTVNFKVNPGKLIKIDSLWYSLHDSTHHPDKDTLQQITQNSLNEALIKRGDPFSKSMISAELDRLSDVYRNNGYLLFTKEELKAVWDTVGLGLLRPTLDPIEQALQLEALRRRRENPTADLEIRLRPNTDSSRLTRYYVGTVKIYPDFTGDTSTFSPKIDTLSRYGYQFVSYQGLFKPRKLIHYISLHRGDLYKQSNYLKTLNKFNSLGSWRLATINQIPRPGEDTVDFDVRLVPAKKYSFRANLEGSRNEGYFLGQGTFLGIGVSLSLTNRNVARSANQSTTNFRFGTELSATGTSIVQQRQVSLGHSIEFPRMIPRLTWLNPKYRENARTLLNFNVAYEDRIDYWNLTTLNTSWGYETSWKNKLLRIRFPNIEYNLLYSRPKLDTLIDSNKSYKYIFNNGLILSSIYNLRIAGGRHNTTNLASFSIEPSGLLLGLIRSSFLDSNLYRFIRVDAEFTQTHRIRRSALAWRVFGGLGYELPSTHNRNNKYMPFFRQYYVGGPNSMRAWAIRKLGPGSTIKSFDPKVAPDRFGDMRLEFNGEYRFYMTQVYGYTIEGALFTDIGNVWFIRSNPDFIGGEFRFDKLWQDIAIGAGTGLRIDFSFLKIRFDYAQKVKNPTPDEGKASTQNKWFYDWRPLNGQFQLGIDYPF